MKTPAKTEKHNGTTIIIGLFAPNADELMQSAIAAGAKEKVSQEIMSISPLARIT